jgi:hypothetical protein
MSKLREIVKSPSRKVDFTTSRPHDLTRIVGQGAMALLLALVFALSPAHAVEPGEMLKDPALEARARRLSRAALRGVPEPVDR